MPERVVEMLMPECSISPLINLYKPLTYRREPLLCKPIDGWI